MAIIRLKIEGADKLGQLKAALSGASKAANQTAQSTTQTSAATNKATQGAKGAAAAINQTNRAATQTAKTLNQPGRGLNQGLSTAAQNLKQVQSWAMWTSVKLDLLTAGMLKFVDVAMKGAQQLEKFTLTTGLPQGDLIRASAMGSRAGLSRQEVAGFITTMQNASSNMMLGGEGAYNWQFLASALHTNLSPAMSSSDLIKTLRQRFMALKNPLDIAVARNLSSRVGISENWFAALRNPEFDKNGSFEKLIALTEHQSDASNKLNADWGELQNKTELLAITFAGSFSPEIDKLVNLFAKLIDKITTFVEWLNSGSTGAMVAKAAIITMALSITAAATAVTVLTGALATLAIVIGGISLAGAVISWVSPLVAAAAAIGLVVEGAKLLRDLTGSHGFTPGGGTFRGHGAGGSWAAPSPGYGMAAPFKNPIGASGNNTSVAMTNNWTINGGGDPNRIARVTQDRLTSALNNARLSAPAQRV